MTSDDGSGYGRIAVVPGEDETLTHVDFGTPMGELMRRYWQPVALSAELLDLPKRIRILCEDLIVFRDRNGRTGVLGLNCCHRGTSLEYGRIEDDGIRCCYHGWKFDAEGRCLEQPGEPPQSDYYEKVHQPWYPVHEYGGLVFAYMGPPDKKPEFPIYDIWLQENFKLHAYRNVSRGVVAECNWLQIQENATDPFHTYFLHSLHSGLQFTDAYAARPDVAFSRTPISVQYIRDAILPNENLFRRVGENFVPNSRSLPPQTETGNTPQLERGRYIGWWVPVDNTHAIGFHIETLKVEVDGGTDGSVWAEAAPGRSNVYQEPTRDYEDTQRRPDDREAQVGQGPIAARARENLATTDQGIVMVRRMLHEALAAIDRGEDPPGIIRNPDNRTVPVGARNEVVAPGREPVRNQQPVEVSATTEA
jgi:phenylpropionate dioxygenase-like ring-hydroxylating dioxygenase large terminal subunit